MQAASPARSAAEDAKPAVDPERILQTATAFWASKALLSAVELDLFTLLAARPMTASAICEKAGLHPGHARDFLDALVALGFLARDGDGAAGVYRPTADTGTFLDRTRPTYIGGMLEMLNARLFGFWNHLTEALRTGKPQNEIRANGKPMFEELYSDEARLGQFLGAMSGVQAGNFHALARKFDFARYKSVTDVGGALALLSTIVGMRHPHLAFNSFDLPPVAPHARRQVEAAGMGARVKIVAGDFFRDELPRADVVTMGNILHDWDLAKKKVLIRKAFAALPAGGALIAIENVIDDARRQNAFGLLMSLNMLIELGDGFDYTFADFRGWCAEAGFSRFELLALAGPASAAIAYK